MVTVTNILTSFPLRLRLTETFNVKNTETKLNRNLNPRKRVHFPEPTAMASSLMRSLTCKTPAKQICSYYLTKTKRNQIVRLKYKMTNDPKLAAENTLKNCLHRATAKANIKCFPDLHWKLVNTRAYSH